MTQTMTFQVRITKLPMDVSKAQVQAYIREAICVLHRSFQPPNQGSGGDDLDEEGDPLFGAFDERNVSVTRRAL